MSYFIRLRLAFDTAMGRRPCSHSIAKVDRMPARHLGLSHVPILCLCLVQTEGLFGQNSPATLPNARISSGGTVNAIAVQIDGKVIIGGQFESVNGISRGNIARLNINGSVDEEWNPGPIEGLVNALALVGTNLFVAGYFEIGGLPRASLAKLTTSGTGTLDASWKPGLGGIVEAIAVHGSHLYVGGGELWLVRVDMESPGAVDTAWTPKPDGFVYALALDGTNLYVGGTFETIGGMNRSALAKVSTVTGRVDPVWNPHVRWQEWSGRVAALVLSGDDLYVGGSFTEIGGQNPTNLAKLSTLNNGSIDPVWNPNPNAGTLVSSVQAVALSGPNLYVSGSFTNIGA